MSVTQTNPDNVNAVDSDLTNLIMAELANIASLQGLLTAANVSPQPNYSISGPTGSRSVDWNGYRQNLLTQINDALNRLKGYFEIKQTNLPFFRYARRCVGNPYYGGGYGP